MKRRVRTYTIGQKRRALAMLRQGYTGKEVEQATGINRHAALGWGRAEGVPGRAAEKISRARRKQYALRRQTVLFQYDVMKRSCAAAAEIAGVNEDTARRWVREAGLTRTRSEALTNPYTERERLRIQRVREACFMKSGGAKVKDIAAHFGVSLQTVWNWWNSEYNIYRPDAEAIANGRRARSGERWAA